MKLNSRTAKPSTDVEVGDVVEVTLGQRVLSFRVVKVADSADKKSAGEMFLRLAGFEEG